MDGPDGTPPIRRRDRRRHDGERVVDEALAIVERSVARLAAQETRPVLDPPPAPFRRRPLGADGLALFPVILSALGFGSRVPEAVAGGLIDMFRSSGGDALLTSDSAAGRHAQEVVGRWSASRRAQSGLRLAAVVGREPQPGAHRAAALTRSVDEALARLQAPVVDLLVLAVDDRGTPLEETLGAVLALRAAGKVRELVLGDWSADRLIEARVMAGQRSLPLAAALHVPYSLADRRVEQRLAPIVQAQQLGLLPRHPLPPASPGAPRLARGAQRRADVLASVAAERRVAPAAVALAWLLTRPSVVAPVVAAVQPDDVATALDAVLLRLTRAEVVALDEAPA